ncbi:pyrroline-5-carboxylate reductase 3 isoform X1 [Thamnophis elegans]|uniref:pyrroline-5-carboxylate reductase 3 isoform X1 n=1 Tax=Thamnophis elegans TaxID=35005 RepID=UPI0013780155|nr:pyrroline-5-carboxylate reductase 3 isoform X1 [Thamnophis elegans]
MEPLRELRVGFIGAGRMASAVARAMLLAGSTVLRRPEVSCLRDNPEGGGSRWRPRLVGTQAEATKGGLPGSCPDRKHPARQKSLFEFQRHLGSRAKADPVDRFNPRDGSPPRSGASWPKTDSWRPDGEVQAVNILASAPSSRNLDKFQGFACRTTHCNLEVLEKCSFVFLATKPHVLPAVLREISPAVTARHVLVSMAAGVPLRTLEELLPAGTRVLRMMPNLPCEVRSGAVLLSRGSSVGEEEVSRLKTLLAPCGLCEEAPESYIDIHTALSGSGVAYVYMFAEALAEGAVKMGMPGPLANKIAAQTLLGAAKMMLETGDHPAVLRSAVCTPGGTTIHALHELEKGSLRATVMNAVEAATSRARELGDR